ncbi:hypothetical protein Taro_031662 [Colocasia esculenta]|uniref:K Homology domain-containing protein n=1 Tax=Colocasia esculenta TaxID=4460 RepID=A0A843VV85_COLES|nr:hypothetical protein [Colocasia esculenta]
MAPKQTPRREAKARAATKVFKNNQWNEGPSSAMILRREKETLLLLVLLPNVASLHLKAKGSLLCHQGWAQNTSPFTVCERDSEGRRDLNATVLHVAFLLSLLSDRRLHALHVSRTGRHADVSPRKATPSPVAFWSQRRCPGRKLWRFSGHFGGFGVRLACSRREDLAWSKGNARIVLFFAFFTKSAERRYSPFRSSVASFLIPTPHFRGAAHSLGGSSLLARALSLLAGGCRGFGISRFGIALSHARLLGSGKWQAFPLSSVYSGVMGETGKRPRNTTQKDNVDGKHQKKRPINRENPNDGELVVYRLLCPDNVIGSVIGKGGKVINSLRQETHAKIKVVDPFPGANERVITIYCYVKEKESMNVDEHDMEPLCPAQDALLRVHDAIVNALSNLGDSDKKWKQEARILVPASQTATIIGKAGATIKKLRSDTGANIKVNQKEPDDPTHSCAMSFDNFVSISGDEESVKKALFAVSAIMYKFSPKEEISLDTTVPELPPSIIIPSDIPVFPAGSIFPSADTIVGPPRSAHPVIGTTTNVSELHGYTDSVSGWPGYASAVPVVSAYSGPSRSEELVVRVLCPSDMIGRVIGKGGSSIKSVRQSSGARIDIDDKKNESEECVITVTSTEYMEDGKSGAVEAVLLLQGKINDEDDETVTVRLLVPSKVIGCLIGKNGSIVNDMRKKTKAKIYISKGEKPRCAGSDDELVEVQGEVSCVRDALAQIVLRLREDALKDRDGGQNAPPVDSFKSSGHPVPAVLPHTAVVAPPVAHIAYDQRAEAGYELGMLPSSSLYGYGSLQGGENGYGSLPSYTSKTYGGGLPSYIEMVVPANAVGKVMGKNGTNLVNIQKISGATVEIVESKTSRGERIARISGTSEQKRTAENVIQAFIMSS